MSTSHATPPRAHTASITGPIPETEDSKAHLLEPYGADRLAIYDYVQEEYFVSGEAAGAPYTTRILVRRPSDMTKFNGRILSEVSHIWGGTSVWRAYNRHLLRGGYMWVEIDSQAPSALGLIKAANPKRYEAMEFIDGELAADFKATIPFDPNPTPEKLAKEYDDFKLRWWEATPQSFEIIAAVARALRAGLPGLEEFAPRTIILAGLSQTGGLARRFIELYHNDLRQDDGSPVFDGYIPAASGGAALPDVDSKVIELLGEAEFQSVRWSCGVSGQVRGLTHRRKDSSSFRLYEVAGMAHRETRFMSDRDKARLKDCPLPEGGHWSKFPGSHIYHAVLEVISAWIEDGIEPPASKVIETVGDTDEIVRDEYGNARGGVRTTFTDVPTSRLIAATPMGRPSWYHGSEIPFDQETLIKRYGTVENYQRAVSRNIDSHIDDRLLLPIDGEELRREAIQVTF
ncbi:alpha/beta hydrolase domain-containing protein [Flaviflexus massiliensis]|uniref:alpha/beta hydrolase domain-containing protein n=1 Tax=Flaviflexus massiliensis TaxID=1522309 RepID=UPI0006D5A251|nr:alpha/beta hydrolase domain-containing protein [Flaviflexus massiliensis]